MIRWPSTVEKDGVKANICLARHRQGTTSAHSALGRAERETMLDLKDRLHELRKEGAEKFAALSAAGSAVRNFADVRRENSAEEYDADSIDEVALSTVKQAVAQAAEVHKMFAHPKGRE